jgi:Glycosyltransferase family 87
MLSALRFARDSLCSPRWVTGERLAVWGSACAIISIALLSADVVTHLTNGVTNAAGEQLARDFINFWSGAKIALGGHAAAAYDPDAFHAYQQSLVGPDSAFKLYSYPPVAMLLCWPLAGLSFINALTLWVAAGALLCAWPLARSIGWKLALLAVVAAPAAFLNVFSGQNGYFTAALIGGGLALIERRPIVAGILLGLLCYKPQFGLLLPIALAAGGYRRSLAAAAATVLLAVAASIAWLGADPWLAFAHQMSLETHMIRVEASWWPRMPTVFAALRLGGVGVAWAYALQAISSVFAALAVIAIWRSSAALGIKAAALVVAMFLATPYAWDYDTIVLIFAAARLAVEAKKSAFRDWERIVVLVLLTLPALTLPAAKLLDLQIGPLLLWLALAVLLRRGFAEAGTTARFWLTPSTATKS